MHFMNSYIEEKQNSFYEYFQVVFMRFILFVNILVYGIMVIDFLYVIYIAKIETMVKSLVNKK